MPHPDHQCHAGQRGGGQRAGDAGPTGARASSATNAPVTSTRAGPSDCAASPPGLLQPDGATRASATDHPDPLAQALAGRETSSRPASGPEQKTGGASTSRKAASSEHSPPPVRRPGLAAALTVAQPTKPLM